ncbi:MAG: Txe/YoeB family addiction module toxin [Tannerella sp.]|jgi:toxin YoeB|nr:Txe/YoeB family addiction module toxin [Tannerella sp.]
MNYIISFKKSAKADIEEYLKSGQKILLKKIDEFLDEIEISPRTGTGKPEHLKYLDETGEETWSRRINKKHRFIYSIDEENKTVEVLSVWGHYKDK